MVAGSLHYLNKLSLKQSSGHHFYRVEDYSFIYNSTGIPDTNSNPLISSNLAL